MTDTSTEIIVRGALAQTGEELGLDHLVADLPGDFDIMNSISSFAAVELLMATEAAIEEATGSYVPLADENLFDAEKSPFRRLDSWIAFVGDQLANA